MIWYIITLYYLTVFTFAILKIYGNKWKYLLQDLIPFSLWLHLLIEAYNDYKKK